MKTINFDEILYGESGVGKQASAAHHDQLSLTARTVANSWTSGIAADVALIEKWGRYAGVYANRTRI